MPRLKSGTQKIQIPDNSIEVVDSSDKPLAIVNVRDVHRQSLMHRAVIVLLYSPEGKLYLQKRSKNKRLYPGRWDVSASGHVYNGQSRKEAALAELNSELGIRCDKLRELQSFKASPETGNEFLTVYAVDKVNNTPAPAPEEVEDGYFYSKSELEWLMREFRELLAPALVFLGSRDLLFK